jgi:hypothetical protein
LIPFDVFDGEVIVVCIGKDAGVVDDVVAMIGTNDR